MNSIYHRILRELYRRTKNFHLPITGYMDAKRLCRLFPELKGYEQLVKPCIAEITPIYRKYITEVSSEDMAVSHELASFLYVLANILKPKRILDLGSGLSSYVFRLYASKNNSDTCVYSVDDSSEWLEKTKVFLQNNNIKSDNLLLWSEFIEADHEKFDLVFHDIGSMEMRAANLSLVLSLAQKNGVIVLDDTHKWEYWINEVSKIREENYVLYSAYKYTFDKYSRFSHIAINKLHNKYTDLL